MSTPRPEVLEPMTSTLPATGVEATASAESAGASAQQASLHKGFERMALGIPVLQGAEQVLIRLEDLINRHSRH
jgi:hypothetical protein